MFGKKLLIDCGKLKTFSYIILLLICLVLFSILFKAYLDGEFDSVESFQLYIEKFGLFAPLILTFIQAAQVVFPVLPGFLGCIVGAVMFGWLGGFLCNYIGISIGSILAFLIARKLGHGIVDKMFIGRKYEKWTKWAAESKSYTFALSTAIINEKNTP